MYTKIKQEENAAQYNKSERQVRVKLNNLLNNMEIIGMKD